MPRYRATETLFVSGARVRAGQEFMSDLPPAKGWEPLDAPAAGKTAKPSTKTELPLENPIDKMDEEQARALIDTKQGKQPGAKVGIQAIREAAKRASNPNGDG